MITNPIVVITGATNGLGQLVASELAKLGAHLILTARSRDKAEATKKMIKNIAPKAEVEFFFGDLSLMKDVKRIGNEINI